MKKRILSFTAAMLLGALASGASNFNGVEPIPNGVIEKSVAQFTIRFPAKVNKNDLKTAPFTVTCSPEAAGFESWADNNTLWTYNFKPKKEYASANLQGGSKCDVVQVADITTSDGKSWKSGSLNYSVTVAGPNVTAFYPADQFRGSLRETDPVMMITFDGPVDRDGFFNGQKGYLSYTSANAPGEKMPLTPAPADQMETLFKIFKRSRYFDTEYTDKNWVIATVKQHLIPGAQIALQIQGQASAATPGVQSLAKFKEELTVRSEFQAEIQCNNPSAKNASCLPKSPISVLLNGRVKWADIKDSYIEYLPYKSKDGKLVKSYPELNTEDQVGFWDSFFDYVGNYIPYMAKFSDTVVNSIVFNVDIEPQTQAKVVLPKGLKDIDNRALSNAIAEFHIRIGASSEVIQVPQQISFFERGISHLYLPVGVVNLNQHLSIRKTGTDAKNWSALHDVPTMIRLIRAYEDRGEYRETPDYVSPLDTLGIKNTVIGQQLTGTKNRPNFLQFPFGAPDQGQPGGFYAIEVSSPTYEASHSESEQNRFYNPKYVLAQVTDLAVHIKRGTKNNLVWVTRLSNAQPVAGATVDIYNCLGQAVKSLKTDASGLANFPSQQWADRCQEGESYSSYASTTEYFAAAKFGDDQTLTHSSWMSNDSYALGAPGVEYFYSEIQENEPYFHGIVGVNLVKPGQSVPVELIAKIPNARGFAEVPAQKLPKKARVVFAEDGETFYEFPLTWSNGTAQFTWEVPKDSSVKMGRYYVQVLGENTDSIAVPSGDIEVAEFKVPLMTGIISFPKAPMVQPANIPVSSVIRYANGVGAKDLATEISYYFQPTSIDKKELPQFSFGSGPVKISDAETNANSDVLPTSSRPATITGLATGADGVLTRDLALEKVADGRPIAEVLKTLDQPQRLVARLRYQDQMGEFQTLSQSKDILNSASYVGTHLVSGTRKDAKLQAAVIDASKNVVTDLADLEYKIVRVEAKVIGEELFGGLIKNTVERELKPVHWNGPCALQEKIVSCPVGALKEGNYAFQVTSKSSHQVAHTFFKIDTEGRVYGRDDYYNFGDAEANKQLPLALNKPTYKNGEKAVVSFPSPFKSCYALVSVERNEVMQAYVSNNACQKGFVEVPVDASQAPNAFVSVFAVTGRTATSEVRAGEMDLGRPTYRLGFANIKVNWSKFKSNVTVKTDKDKYQPGETVDVQVNVTPEEGQLKNGSVTLVVLEEKILELKANETYKALEALMQLRGHQVRTITALERIETVTTPANEAAAEAPGSGRKGGDEGGDGSSKSEFKRKLFNALVSFQPDVPVQNGVAKFKFKTNDSLTRFKVFAIALDPSEKFGTGETGYLTEKDTQSYSNIPTVAHSGDSFPVKVTVQNNGAASAKYKVEVKAVIKNSQGTVIGNKTLTQNASVDKGASATVDVGQFDVGDDAQTVQYDIHVYDENGKIVDAMQPDVQTVLPAVPLAIHDSYILQVQDGTLKELLQKEPTALDGKGEIQVSVNKSLVSSALTQIVNRFNQDTFADFFIESKFNKALLNSSAAHPEELKKVLETLIANTDAAGLVKYHPLAQRGSVWLTASILNSLQLEPWALKLLPGSLAERLKGAVSQVLTKSLDPSYLGEEPMAWVRAQSVMGQAAFAFDDENLKASATAAFQTIATSLQQNPAAYGLTLDKWSSSDLVEYWLLEVFASPDTAATSGTYKKLTNPALLIFTGNMAQLKGQPSYHMFYSDETVETAKLLLGHSRLRMKADLARSLAVGLVNANTKGWYSSSTLNAVAEGLKAFGRSYESEAVTGNAVIALVEMQKSQTVDWSAAKTATLNSEWKENKATVQVTQSGAGKPWVSIQALTAVPLTAPLSQGLSIEKQMRNVSRDSGYKAGDVLEVTLKITSSGDVNHVALQDPIPAGSNILGDAYGDLSSGEKSYSGYKFYFETLPSGVSTVKYQFQLNNPGSFKLPPTRAQGLYLPSVFGETPNTTMNVD